MSNIDQNDILYDEIEAQAMFCRKCGQKLSPSNNTQCEFCGTVVEYHTDTEASMPETEEAPTSTEAKPKKKKAKNSYLHNGAEKLDGKLKRIMYFTKRQRNKNTKSQSCFCNISRVTYIISCIRVPSSP